MATTTTTTAAEIAQERLLTWVHSLVFDELAPSEEPAMASLALVVSSIRVTLQMKSGNERQVGFNKPERKIQPF